MTSIPEVPSAPAVYLYREEVSQQFRDTAVYVRIKVLTEKGKEYGNIELPFGGDLGVTDIAARTIHSDGTIVSFSGQPYEKLIEKERGQKYKVKILSLPSVEVGSILEYRYRWTGFTPDWYVQSELFTRKAHYLYRVAENQQVVWTEILPPGAKVQQVGKPSSGVLALDVQNIAPRPHEDMMPPINSVSYRVLFFSSTYTTAADFWKANGDSWSKALNDFIGPAKKTKAAVAALVKPDDGDELKLRKIYAAIMEFDNADLTRALSAREKKAKGLKEVSSVDDIFAAHRGSGDGLTVLFVAMARAAGMKAYVMAVADRSERLFIPGYLSFGQLDDYIAVVKVNGADRWFDPGQRFCPFGQLAWFHGIAGGIRQTDDGSAIEHTPPAEYKENHISRIADLKLDEHGSADGSVTLAWVGAPTMRWRQAEVTGDDTSLKEALKHSLETMLPPGMEVQVVGIEDLHELDKPLTVKFHVAGPIGSTTGKRLILPASFFESQNTAKFTAATRDVSIDLHYPSATQDAVRYAFPASLAVESVPPAGNERMTDAAAYTTRSTNATNSVTLYRNLTQGRTMYQVSEYSALRDLYVKMEARDHESVVLTHAEAHP